MRLAVSRSALARRVAGETWPAVLSNPTTLLETGEVLPQGPPTFGAG